MSLSNKAIVTMEDAKAILKIQNDQDDALIEMEIEGVSAQVCRFLDRELRSATYTAVELNGSGTRTLQLPSYPVTDLDSVYLGELELTEGEDFELDYESGILTLSGSEGVWTAGPKTVTVTYTAGYALADIPKDIRMAALIQTAFEHQQFVGKAWGISSRGQSQSNVSYETGGLLERVRELLEPHRRRGV